MSTREDRPTNMVYPNLYSVNEAARSLGLHVSSIRRLLIEANNQGQRIGTKLNAKAWMLTEEEVELLRERDDRRGDWQKDGGRSRMLEAKREGNFVPKRPRD